MRAKMKMALEAMLVLLVMGMEVVSAAASQCSSRNGGEELSCQLRTLQSGLQASTFKYQLGVGESVMSLSL